MFFSLSVFGPRLLAVFDWSEPSAEAAFDIVDEFDDVDWVELLGDDGGSFFFLGLEGEVVDDTDLLDSFEYFLIGLRGVLVDDGMSENWMCASYKRFSLYG